MSNADASRRSGTSRRAILDAARALVLDVGYGALSIEGIASKAKVGKQTIYRWWPSKGAVVFEAFLAAPGDRPEAPELPDTGDLARDMKRVLRATITELREPSIDAAFRGIAAEIQSDVALAKQLVDVLLAPQMASMVRRLERARHAKQVRRGVDLGIAAEMLFGPIFHRWLLRTKPLEPKLADALVDMTLRALAPEGAAPASARPRR